MIRGRRWVGTCRVGPLAQSSTLSALPRQKMLAFQNPCRGAVALWHRPARQERDAPGAAQARLGWLWPQGAAGSRPAAQEPPRLTGRGRGAGVTACELVITTASACPARSVSRERQAGAAEPRAPQRDIAPAGRDQGLEVRVAPMPARLAPHQHPDVAGGERAPSGRQGVGRRHAAAERLGSRESSILGPFRPRSTHGSRTVDAFTGPPRTGVLCSRFGPAVRVEASAREALLSDALKHPVRKRNNPALAWAISGEAGLPETEPRQTSPETGKPASRARLEALIRRRRAEGATLKELAKSYNVGRATTSRLVA